MKTWVKLHTTLIRDPDLFTLTWGQRGIWAALLALAGEIDERDADDAETGALDTIEYTALRIRCELGEFREALAVLASRGLVEDRDGVLYLARYAEEQMRKPSARPTAVRERVARYRDLKRAEAEPVTPCNADVTRVKRAVTRLELDSDTDADTPTGVPVGDAETATPPVSPPVLAHDPEPEPAPEPKPEPVPKAKRERVSVRDPRTGHPAVQAYRSITGKLPPKPLYDAVIATLGENGPPEADVGRARDCYHAWLARGYNPSALTWLLEWYKTGIPKPDGGNGKRASPQTVPEVDWVAYAKEVEARRHGDATAERASQHG